MHTEGLLIACSQLTTHNSKSISLLFLDGGYRDVQLLLPLVVDAGEGDLQEPVFHSRRGAVRVDRPGQRDGLDERAEVALHAEETDPLARADPPLLVPADGQDPPPDGDRDVLGFDARKL